LIEKFSKKSGKTKKIDADYKKNDKDLDIRIILRMGIYQIKYMESVPDRAAVSEMVDLTKALGLDGMTGYVNGLLRNVVRAKEDKKLDSFLVSRMDVRYSTPQWLCDFLVETYGKETARTILEDQYKEHDTVVRINSLKTSKEELRKMLEEAGVDVKDGILSDRCLRISGYDSIRRLPGFNKGLFMVQDETSTYTVEHIGIKPGDKVLDICSAPGGKSLLAYELATDGGKAGVIVSRDISDKKLDKIRENAERMGASLTVEIGDATELDKDLIELPDDEKFDVVIADVPCSGLGVIGRKNDIKYHMTPESLTELSKQGLLILKNSSMYIKKKGKICFSTCTINPQENEKVVRAFLNEYDFEILEERTFIQGIDSNDGFYFCIMQNKSLGTDL
jgi:16S rRNA (cytosine967-C5)-methyltransferase